MNKEDKQIILLILGWAFLIISWILLGGGVLTHKDVLTNLSLIPLLIGIFIFMFSWASNREPPEPEDISDNPSINEIHDILKAHEERLEVIEAKLKIERIEGGEA